MRDVLTSLAAVASLSLAAAPSASAHHALNAQFDVTKTLAFTGVLESTELINPHSYLHFVAKDAAGKTVNWSFETATPQAMKRLGISIRDAFIPGTTYTLYYSPSRSGAPIGVMHAILLPDGRFVGTGSPNNIEAARALIKAKS
jgi:hypothetical protein